MLYLTATRQQSANHATIDELLDPNGRFVEHSINVKIKDIGLTNKIIFLFYRLSVIQLGTVLLLEDLDQFMSIQLIPVDLQHLLDYR